MEKYNLGIDIGGTFIKYALVDKKYNIKEIVCTRIHIIGFFSLLNVKFYIDILKIKRYKVKRGRS